MPITPSGFTALSSNACRAGIEPASPSSELFFDHFELRLANLAVRDVLRDPVQPARHFPTVVSVEFVTRRGFSIDDDASLPDLSAARHVGVTLEHLYQRRWVKRLRVVDGDVGADRDHVVLSDHQNGLRFGYFLAMNSASEIPSYLRHR